MSTRLITSKDNRLLKTMRLVASQARRAPDDLVLAEGTRTIEEAIAAGCAIEAAITSERFGRTVRELAVLEGLSRRRAALYEAADSLIRSISDVIRPQGVIALVRVTRRSLGKMRYGLNPLVLCAWGIQDPGNLGTLIRTAAAAGVSLVCTTAGTVSARNPKCIRSSAGAFFRIPVIEGVAAAEFFDHCRERSLRTYRTSANEGISYLDAVFRSGCVILLGNEGSGIPELQRTSLPCLRIPLADGVESLNVAAAGAVLLFEAVRQRMGGGGTT